MTLDDLRSIIQSTAWFTRLGEPDYRDHAGYIVLPNLDPWKSVTGILAEEAVPSIIEQGMDWLPSSNDQPDPIHDPSLQSLADAAGKRRECSQHAAALYKECLTAMRAIGDQPMLKVGAHDFTGAARGAALYAVRQAAYEIILNEVGFWCRMVEIYRRGHWPCGLMPDGTVVIL